MTYPSGLVLKYVYTATRGYLSQIKDNTSGTIYWQANTRDAEMHALTQTAGNGIVTTQVFDANTGRVQQIRAWVSDSVANFSYGFDTIGNLTSRADTYQGYTEKFCYDVLSRLTNYAIAATCTGTGTKTVGYSDNGNITSKSDVGTYSYPSPGSARPHAISSITGTVNGTTNPTYTYDSNGNMTAGAGRTIRIRLQEHHMPTGCNDLGNIVAVTRILTRILTKLNSRAMRCMPSIEIPVASGKTAS